MLLGPELIRDREPAVLAKGAGRDPDTRRCLAAFVFCHVHHVDNPPD